MEKVLPADVSVLAMDIDAEALKEVDRQNCVGDITAIPVKDGAVDMVMACDVLEHLADDALQKAVSELERVSRRVHLLAGAGSGRSAHGHGLLPGLPERVACKSAQAVVRPAAAYGAGVQRVASGLREFYR